MPGDAVGPERANDVRALRRSGSDACRTMLQPIPNRSSSVWAATNKTVGMSGARPPSAISSALEQRYDLRVRRRQVPELIALRSLPERRLRLGVVLASFSVLASFVLPVSARSDDSAVGLLDVSGHIFEKEIAWMVQEGISRGCNPPVNDRFCPDDPVTRGQMAAFLYRALGLEPGDVSFRDTVGHLFETEVSSLASAGITRGCNPPVNDRFCPDDPLTRGQVAAFLYRAFRLQPEDVPIAATLKH